MSRKEKLIIVCLILTSLISIFFLFSGFDTLQNSTIIARTTMKQFFEGQAINADSLARYINDMDSSLKTIGTIKSAIGGIILILSGIAIFQIVKKHN